MSNPPAPDEGLRDRLALATALLTCVKGLACPRDTDGDGGCGRPMCPYCGEPITRFLTPPATEKGGG